MTDLPTQDPYIGQPRLIDLKAELFVTVYHKLMRAGFTPDMPISVFAKSTRGQWVDAGLSQTSMKKLATAVRKRNYECVWDHISQQNVGAILNTTLRSVRANILSYYGPHCHKAQILVKDIDRALETTSRVKQYRAD